MVMDAIMSYSTNDRATNPGSIFLKEKLQKFSSSQCQYGTNQTAIALFVTFIILLTWTHD